MQTISPEKVFRGANSWLKAIPEILKFSKRPLILGRSKSTEYLRTQLSDSLKNGDKRGRLEIVENK